MECKKSLLFLRVLAAALLVSLGAVAAFAVEEDPDPNSPTPVILTYTTSTRALAVNEGASKRIDLSRIPERAFITDSRIVFFVGNLTLVPGEGANAFRVYAQDSNGHYFRFPVLAMEPADRSARGTYAITVQL